MTDTLSTALMIAAGRSALYESHASEAEVEEIVNQLGEAGMARELVVWGNPTQWAQYTLVMHRLRSRTAAKHAGEPTPTPYG